MKCSLFCLEVKAGALGHLVETFQDIGLCWILLRVHSEVYKKGKLYSWQSLWMMQLCQGPFLPVDNNPRWLTVKSDKQGWKFSAPGDRETRPYQELRLWPGKGLIHPQPPTPRISQGSCPVALLCCYRARCSLRARGVSTPQPSLLPTH